MPVNYLQIQDQIRKFAANTAQRQLDIQRLKEHYLSLYNISANSQLELIDRIEAAIRANPNLRCAVPTHEKMNVVFPLPNEKFPVTMIAADGSQIIPSRHRQVEFGMINISAVSMRFGSKDAPIIAIDSQLVDMDEMHQEVGMKPDGYIALVRDVAERIMLADKTANSLQPVITLTDGVLDLFRALEDSKIYKQKLHEYHSALEKLMGLGAITVAYVDKPGSSFVLKMLEIGTTKDGNFQDSNKLSYLPDMIIFNDILLHPGERSALFKKQSFSAEDFQGDLSIYFFYLNISKDDHPDIVRVEVPAWVATDSAKMQLLHGSLVEQAWLLANPYPYVLHRAHEEAVVSFEESSRMEEMIISQLLKDGVKIGRRSNKQTHKDHTGRRRYGS